MSRPLVYRRLRAPTGDGEVLIEPSICESSARIDFNVRNASQREFKFAGRSIQELSRDARAQLLSSAVVHTQKYAPHVATPTGAKRIYLVGHQPEFFHPGVWLKNFVLDAIAKRDGAVAIHVLIDNDIAGAPTIATPTGSVSNPTIAPIAFDRSITALPWEERTLLDAELFPTTGQRLAATLAPFVESPLASQIWKHHVATVDEGHNLGHLLAGMRYELERQWGLNTWEVPLSKLCQGPTFRWFVALILSQLPRLHDVHNRALAEYRQVHKLRSTSRPIPDLEQVADTLETPFWIWSTANPRRRKLFARVDGDAMVLSDGEAISLRLSDPVRDTTALVEKLAGFESDGVKIRPRALMTTLYLRVFLGDYFIHGIGGAKYDQITDRLIEELFGFPAPAYMVATGTRCLPSERDSEPPTSTGDIDRQLRELEFHPEKHLPADLAEAAKRQADGLVAEKRALFQGGNDIDPRERHAALQRINAALLPHVASVRQRLEQQRRQVERNVQARRVLDSRELSFCLFPEATLRPWLLDAAVDAS